MCGWLLDLPNRCSDHTFQSTSSIYHLIYTFTHYTVTGSPHPTRGDEGKLHSFPSSLSEALIFLLLHTGCITVYACYRKPFLPLTLYSFNSPNRTFIIGSRKSGMEKEGHKREWKRARKVWQFWELWLLLSLMLSTHRGTGDWRVFRSYIYCRGCVFVWVFQWPLIALYGDLQEVRELRSNSMLQSLTIWFNLAAAISHCALSPSSFWCTAPTNWDINNCRPNRTKTLLQWECLLCFVHLSSVQLHFWRFALQLILLCTIQLNSFITSARMLCFCQR